MPAYSLIPTPLEISRRDELSTKIMQYQGTRAARRRMEAELEELGQRRNIPLPPELMGIIFDFYVHLYGHLPERLLLVCHAWHALALSRPTLWANLDPLGPFGLNIIRPWAGTFIQSRIARSNPAPLKVDFSNCSRNIQSKDMKKIAATRTFRPRIQALVVAYTRDFWYLTGDQPLLKHLTFGEFLAFDEVNANPVKYKLFDKPITTLRLRGPTGSLIWPESLLRRLQTLEVTLTGNVGVLHQYWAMVQKSVALLALHITMRFGSAPSLSHASCRSLTIVYSDDFCSLEEVRMPHLQQLTIVTYTRNELVRLVDTPISVLRLTCKFQYEDMNDSWVQSAIRLLRSAPCLERFEIFAPSDIVATLSEALTEDLDLCTELHSFIINGPTGTELEAGGHAQMNVGAAELEQLRDYVAAFLDQRRLRRSKN